MRFKRSRSRSRSLSTAPYAKRARVAAARRKAGSGTVWMRRVAARALSGVNRLTRMIETKEGSRRAPANQSLYHNNIHVVQDTVAGGNMNPFYLTTGDQDPMGTGGNRLGDKISVRGLAIKMMIENALARPKVFYHFMIIRAAKGDVPTRATLYKGCSDNKIIDQINTERFSLVASKKFYIKTANTAPTGVTAITGVPTGETGGGQGTRVLSLWIPGRKFGRRGDLQYENASVQVKFYDYYLIFMTYDWFGTSQDVNAIGKINELYTKLYFKDA